MTLVASDFIRSRLVLPVAIFGGGVSGSGARSLAGAVGAEAVVYDSKGEPFTEEASTRHGLAVYSPGFPPDHPWLAIARAAGCLCLPELDFAALFWRGRIIAVTGTNGKTTLTEFIAHALRSTGRQAHAAGNVGFPFARLAAESDGGEPGTAAVCEVSSFQAEELRHFRADSAIWTNFAEDHLERHPGMEAYFSAKWNLLERTEAGHVFAGCSVRAHAERYGRSLPGIVWVPTENQMADLRLAGTVFAEYPQRENFLLASAWWRSEGLPESALYAAARSFQLGRHRLSRVGQLEGVTYWNDSKATNFHAVEAALAGFRRPVHLIAGGKSKGGDIAAFVRRISPRVRHAYLIGETRAEMAAAFTTEGVPHGEFASIEEAVAAAGHSGRLGDHVVLSPGFASFDLFRNYEDRGERFERAVSSLQTVRT